MSLSSWSFPVSVLSVVVTGGLSFLTYRDRETCSLSYCATKTGDVDEGGGPTLGYIIRIQNDGGRVAHECHLTVQQDGVDLASKLWLATLPGNGGNAERPVVCDPTGLFICW